MPCAGRPLIGWCAEALAASGAIGAIVVAAPAGREREAREAVAAAAGGLAVDVVAGGATRAESVAGALSRVDAELVAVQDAARPLTEPELIAALVERVAGDRATDGAIAAAPVTDTIKRVPRDARAIAATEDRAELWAAQTPQVFRTEVLRRAHGADPGRLAAATDDAMLVELAGGRVVVEPAPAGNLKVTTPADLRLAELLLRDRA